MMYKVVIADDEAMIREGLEKAIDWQALECEVVGVAQNGMQALTLIQQTRADLLVTDIKMPGKSGLDLAQEALQFQPDLKMIVLSGYNEFDYARKALHLGVIDYLLKPTVFSDVTRSVQKAIDTIRKERKMNEELRRFRLEFENHFDQYRQSFLRQLLLAPLSTLEEGLNEKLALYRFKRYTQAFVVQAKIDNEALFRRSFHEEKWQLTLIAFDHHMKQAMKDRENVYVVPSGEGTYALICEETKRWSEEHTVALCNELQEVAKSFHISLSFGISRKKRDMKELHKAYLEASEALQHQFYFGNEAIIFFHDLVFQNNHTDASHSYPLYVSLMQPIIQSLKIGDEKKSLGHLRQLFTTMKSNQEGNDGVKTVCVDLLSQIVHSVMNYEKRIDLEPIFVQVMKCSTIDACQTLLESLIGDFSVEIYEQTRSHHKKTVDAVLTLMQEHYQENITLQWISERIYLNSSYISRLLKNELGETFTECLTKIRMERAKQLLRDPQAKIYEVAEQIGIPDAHYFSVKFKKYTGISPSEYRDHFIDLF